MANGSPFLPWCIFQATRNVADIGTQREIWESNVLGGKQRRKYAGVGVGAESFRLLREEAEPVVERKRQLRRSVRALGTDSGRSRAERECPGSSL